MGFVVVVRKDPKKGYLRIKSLPRADIDLTALYDRLKKDEPEATWFLHASRHMVLNGSSKNPDMKPSRRPLHEFIEADTKLTNRLMDVVGKVIRKEHIANYRIVANGKGAAFVDHLHIHVMGGIEKMRRL